MKKKEWLIVIVVIAFGLIYNLVKKGDGVFFGGCNYEGRRLMDRGSETSFPAEACKLRAEDGIKQVKIDNPAGDIVVGKSDDGDIHIQPVIRVYHRKKAKADKIAKAIGISCRKTGGGIMDVDVVSEEAFPYRRVRVSFKCLVPEGVALDIKNNYGNVDIQDAGGDVTVASGYGELFVKNVKGAVEIAVRHGEARLYEIDGHLKLASRSTPVKIKHVASLKMRASYDKVSIEGVRGKSNVEYAGYCTLEIENSGPVVVDGRHLRLKLAGINGDVRVNNSHGPINMERISAGTIDILGKQCRIDLEKITTGLLVINNKHNHVDIREASCKKMQAGLRNSDLDLELLDISGDINIKGKNSDIMLALPKDAQPALNITTHQGQVTNRTGSEMEIREEKRKNWLNTPGAESNGPTVMVYTDFGDVVLKNTPKSSADIYAAPATEVKPELEEFKDAPRAEEKAEPKEEEPKAEPAAEDTQKAPEVTEKKKDTEKKDEEKKDETIDTKTTA